MAILTRYLLRAHVGPFLFALTALTGMLFLNAVAQRMEDLAGKGLEWDVIAEFLILSLPHTVALTLPMAVLVAVLYAFSELTAANEITAMAAGGVKPTRLLVPLVGVGAIVAASMGYFNDQILPHANHELKNLLLDVGRKSPTFELREQVVNRIRTSGFRSEYFLQAARIDPVTNELQDVVIFDMSDPQARRTTFAERGSMAFSPDRTDLYLTLYDGVVHEVTDDRPDGFQRLFFEREIVPMRGVGNILERETGTANRGDREMTVAMLLARAREREGEAEQIRTENRELSRAGVLLALGRPLPEDARVAPPSSGAPGLPSAGHAEARMGEDELVRHLAMGVRTNAARLRTLELTAVRYRVEVHKKYSIAFACIVFVLIGAPLAVRFPRGGVGMVIVVSVAIFAIYWIFLIGGEKLSDRGLVDPFWAMWTPNFVFAAIGLLLARRMGRTVATSRGGGWDDLLWTLKKGGRRVFGRRPQTAA